jgi:flagellar biogenesis protein FliO
MTRLVLVLVLTMFLPHHAAAQGVATPTPARSVYDGVPVKPKEVAESRTANNPATSFDWQRLVLAMVVVLGAIFALRAVAAKYVPGMATVKASKAVRVLSRSPISPRQQIMLLQVGRRVIVVGEQAGQMAALSEITDADEVAALVGQIENDVSITPKKPFAALFSKSQDAYEPQPQPQHRSSFEPSIEKPDREIEDAHEEISGLIDRMRSLTRTINRDP